MSEAEPEWDDLIVETTEIIGAVRAPAGRRSVGGRDGNLSNTLSNKAKAERVKTNLAVSTET